MFLIGKFWKKLTGFGTDNFEGNTTSQIHNPTIHYFCQILEDTIFGWEDSNKTNPKEIFYLQVIFAPTPINSAPFLMANLNAVRTVSKGSIAYGGMITSIDRVLGLDTELSTLEYLPPYSFDIQACRSMRFVRARPGRKFLFMVHNMSIDNIVLPCPQHTDMHREAN